MRILITGSAGFIGSRTAEVLASNGIEVLGIDDINDYYDPQLKLARLKRGGFIVGSKKNSDPMASPKGFSDIESLILPAEGDLIESSSISGLSFIRMDIRDSRLEEIVARFNPDLILHLAAQPGVRYSISHPEESLECNVMTFARILEVCRSVGIRRLIYASSSSVYGEQSPHAFSETDVADNPASIYSVSKRTNEMLASVYAETYGMQITGLRFFSVYGEWGRPDMAPYLFTRAILEGSPLTLFNGGQSSRDFTYIEDVVKCILLIVENGVGIFKTGKNHEIFNIGHGSPTLMKDFVALLERLLDRKADVRMLPMQPGDVLTTLADTSKFKIRYGYAPHTSLQEGLERFIRWYSGYFGQDGCQSGGNRLKELTRLA